MGGDADGDIREIPSFGVGTSFDVCLIKEISQISQSMAFPLNY